MGGLAPGIGGLELLVIALVALVVVGPKDLPLMLRKLGQFTARARAMAAEFRASFDEIARQSELDELRKEVEALRTGQSMQRLGPEAEATFREIRNDLNRPLDGPAAPAALESPAEAAPEVASEAPPEPAVARTPSAKRNPSASAARKPVASYRTGAAKKPAVRKASTARKPKS